MPLNAMTHIQNLIHGVSLSIPLKINIIR